MDTNAVMSIVSRLSGFEEVESAVFLDKGYSHEQKYALLENNTIAYLMRVCGIEHHKGCERVFHLMELHYANGVRCSEPLYIGVHEEASVCFSIYGYIQGDCAEDVLPSMPVQTQYELGIQSGRELHKIHRMPCPDSGFDWYEHRSAKHFRQLDAAKRIGIELPGGDLLPGYIRNNLEIMKGRSSTFQHDDYHPGNLIVIGGQLAGVIDFNRCDWGDPLHELYKLPQLTCYMSIPFAVGQIVGYFGGEPGGDFWRLYNLYVAMSIAPSLYWGMNYGGGEFELFSERAEGILSTHDFASGGPPSWYTDFQKLR